jgi:2-oxoglutarate ferredoxin oxidoreductase subunit delta
MGKGIVEVNEDRCKGCELCVSVCPVNILALHSMKINSKGFHPVGVVSPEKCLGCTNCATICPDGAISIYVQEKKGRSE